MAPTIAIPSSNYQENNQRLLRKPKPGKILDENERKMEEMRKRNEELEKELNESKKREERMRKEVEKAWERVRIAEEAEELLCNQLGDIEVEAVEQTREFHARVNELMHQLSQAHRLLQSVSANQS